MGVLLKGIRKPQKGYVDVRIFSDGTATLLSNQQTYYQELETVDVPTPHGRLIDGDELFNRDMQIYYGNTVVGKRSYIFKSDVAEMPTIIEAEE